MVRAADFDREHLLVDTSKMPKRHVAPAKLRKLRLRPGDLVLEKSGGGEEAPVGLAVVWDHDVIAVPSNFAARLRAAAGVDPGFLRYLFGALYYMRLNERSIKQTTGIQNIDVWSFLDERCVVPQSIEDQNRISKFLAKETTRVDAVVDAKKKLQGILHERRLALIEAGVAGRLTSAGRTCASDIPWLPVIPSGWSSAQLKYVARQGTGHTPSRKHPEWWTDCTIPWITTGDVHRFRDDRLEELAATQENISRLGVANSSAVVHPKGTVVLSRTASVGFSVIMGSPMATSQDFATWTCGKRVLPEFVLYCLRAMRRDLLGRLAQGSTHQTIYMPDIQRIRVPVPPVPEQRAIVKAIRAELVPLDHVSDLIRSQLPRLLEYRRSIVVSAVTGQVEELLAG